MRAMRKSRRPRRWRMLDELFAALGAPLASALVCLVCATAAAAKTKSSDPAESNEPVGAVIAPATLPEGAAALYAYGGIPEVAVGYRQGVSSVEVEARAKFNYVLVSFAFEVLLKHAIASDDAAALAPFIGIGIAYDFGSRYITTRNFQYTAIRGLAGLIGTYRLGDLASLIGELDLPLDLSVNPARGFRFTPLAGGGLEIYLGPSVTGLLLGQLGVDFLREPLGVPQWGLGYEVRAGFGFRLF